MQFDPTDSPNSIPADEQPSFKFPDNSQYGRLVRHWNKRKADGGMNANGFEKFPMMLHCARETQPESGTWVTSKPEPEFIGFRNEAEWGRELQRVSNFNKTCQQVVQNEQEYDRLCANGEGWRDTPAEAMAFRESLEAEIGTAALETEIASRKMSPAAQREAREAINATSDHVPEIPRTPVRKPGKRPAA